MNEQLLDLIRLSGATIYDPDFGEVVEGWRVQSAEEHDEDGTIEWVRQIKRVEPDEPTPVIAPATQLVIVSKALAAVGYGWRLQSRDRYGARVTRLRVRPANTSLEERIIEHVCRSLEWMRRCPSAWGSREARETTCIELMNVRWLASGQEARVDEVTMAWSKAINKVRGVAKSTPLFLDFEGIPEIDFMEALMSAVERTRVRLPLQSARLREFERAWERGARDETNEH
jgi:hypothetical protein